MYQIIRTTSLLLLMLVATSARGFDAFIVENIRVDGLQRITIGTVLNYFPIKEGEEINDGRSSEVIRALFKTGFFDDVSLSREGDVLVVTVTERPSIASIKISGNKDIKTDQLREALKSIGLTEGRVFDRSLLDKIKHELERQYFSQGKYGIKIKSTESLLDDNRTDIFIEIDEGRVARILRINIVGNKAFDDAELKNKLELSPPESFSLFSSNDQYSKQKLSADLETLRSHYLDQGYINFTIDSTQVSITPDKKDVYVTINITEGDQYTVRDVRLAGDLIVDSEELVSLITIKSGDIFSRKKTTESSAAINDRLGKEGFAFANINPVPDIDKENKQVVLTFFVDPGKRVYVRRINVAGNHDTRDEIIRREVRQMEGGWISTKNVNRSRIRLQRLGYFEDVNVETPSVPGIDDQIDVNLSVTEKPSGSLMAGIGYSQGQGFLVNASVSKDNFLGDGKRISATVNNSSVNTIYSFSYTNPYYTLDGISRGFKVFSRETDAGEADVAEFTTDIYGGSVRYGFPLSEFNTASLELGLENTKINTTTNTPQSYRDFIDENTDQFDIIRLTGGWAHDTRNRAVFSDEGGLKSISTEIALPGSGLQFYKLKLRSLDYFPLTEDLTFFLKGESNYGDSYSNTTELPFFERFYAGGNNSVRGFRNNSLGPQEDGEPRGGSFKLVGSAELIFPVPFAADNKSLRLSTFFDIGNVYDDYDNFDVDELRTSTGFSAIWLSPIAPLTFSYTWPLNDEPGDEIERFQFTLGAFNF